MNFDLTEEEALIEQTAREFADKELAPRAEYAEPILQGKEWPKVDFDWGGVR